MRNITGQAVIGDDLYGREYELSRLWEMLEQGEHILRSNLLRQWWTMHHGTGRAP